MLQINCQFQYHICKDMGFSFLVIAAHYHYDQNIHCYYHQQSNKQEIWKYCLIRNHNYIYTKYAFLRYSKIHLDLERSKINLNQLY